MRVYVTDGTGRVMFDSTGRNEGRDFSRWNDVSRTLRGEYGARSSRDIAGDDDTQVIYVAAPVRQNGRIVGVVSVGKTTRGINALVAVARRKILLGRGNGRHRPAARAAARGFVGHRTDRAADRLCARRAGPATGPAAGTARPHAS